MGLVTPNYYPNVKGGGELSVKLLAEGLVNRGHKVLIISFDFSSNLPREGNINGVKVVRLKQLSKSAQFLSLTLPVAIAMKSWEKYVDIYHIYNVSPLAGGGLYKTLGGTKKVVATLIAMQPYAQSAL